MYLRNGFLVEYFADGDAFDSTLNLGSTQFKGDLRQQGLPREQHRDWVATRKVGNA
jgi:hypothetical protein